MTIISIPKGDGMEKTEKTIVNDNQTDITERVKNAVGRVTLIRLKQEIDRLYERLFREVKKENEELKEKIDLLRAENAELYKKLAEKDKNGGYFSFIRLNDKKNIS